MLEPFGMDTALFLFLVALLAGFIDAMAGGGGLLALPALLSTGISPLQALATNKFQGSFGTFAAVFNFYKKGHLNLRRMAPAMALTFLGAASGTLLVQFISADFLRLVTPVLLVGIVLFFALQPGLGEQDRAHKISLLAFSLTFGFGLGFYDGFFGPGTGSFFTFAFVLMLGFNLVRATAHTKLLNFISNITSLLLFIASGHVIWEMGLIMAVGQFVGGYLGAHMTLRHGARLIRPLVIAMSLAMTAKLVYDNL